MGQYRRLRVVQDTFYLLIMTKRPDKKGRLKFTDNMRFGSRYTLKLV